MLYLPVRLITVPWLIPAWAQAQVWGRFILLRRGIDVTEALLAHELAHVLQWHTLGVLPFLYHYLAGLIRFGYRAHPLEQAARAAEHSGYYRAWARHFLEQAV
jgi:hypothetical protein